MPEAKFTFEFRDVEAFQFKLKPEFREGLYKNIGELLVNSVKRTIREGGRPDKWPKSGAAEMRGGITLRFKGRLYNSIAYQVDGDKIFVGPNVRYAAILQKGGEIKPVNKKFLTVPIHKLAQGKRAGDFSHRETFIAKGVIFLKKSKDEVIPLFALRKVVTIPAFPYLPEERLLPADEKRIQRFIWDWVKRD